MAEHPIRGIGIRGITHKAKRYGIDGRLSHPQLTGIKQGVHGLPLETVLLAATPADNTGSIDEELKEVQCFGWMRRRDAVGKPEPRERVDWDVARH